MIQVATKQQNQSNNVAYTGDFVAFNFVKCYKVAYRSNNVALALLPVRTRLQ